MIIFPLLLAAAAAFADTTADSAGPASGAAPAASTIGSLDTLVVQGRRHIDSRKFGATSPTTIDSSVLLNTPGTANDVNRILALHPSVLSTGVYNDNALYVRGGHPTENAYVIDGMTFDDINHYTFVSRPGGGFGFIDPDMVERLDIYAGGIPVNFPARTSSVIELALRNGAADRKIYKADVSVMGFGIAGEGPLPDSSGSYLAGVRFADMSLLRRMYEKIGTPRYGDGLAKFTIDLKKAGTLSLFALGSFDLYRGVSGETAEGYDIPNHALIRSNAGAGSVTWNRVDPALFHSLQLSVSRTEAERSRMYTGGRDTLLLDSIFQGASRTGYYVNKKILIGDRVYTAAIRKLNVSAVERVSFPLGDRADLSAGLSAELHRIGLRFQYGMGLRECYYRTTTDGAASGQWGGPEPGCSSPAGIFDNDTVVDNVQTGAYAQLSARIGSVTVSPGVRADYYSLIDRGGLSPRLAVTWRHDALGTFSATGAVVSQLPTGFDGLLSYLLVNRESSEPGNVELADFRLQRCYQAAAAFSRALGRRHTLGIEAYVKSYENQYALLNPERRDLGLKVLTDLNGDATVRIGRPDGGQRVRGAEATFSNDRNSRLFYSAACSYSISRHRYVDGTWHADKFGECGKASVAGGFRIGTGHVLTAGLLAMTGRHYSVIDPLSSGGWQWDLSRGYLSERLEPVYSLSSRYTFEHRFRRVTVGAYVEAINILNQKQLIDRELDALGYNDHYLVGVIPNAAVLVSF